MRLTVRLIVLTLILASCGISADDGPREIIDRGQASIDTASATAAGASTGSARIYLLSSEVAGQERTIEPVARNVRSTAADVLSALLSGPNATELDQQLRTAIPADTRLLGTRRVGDVLAVDLSEEIEQVTGEVLKQAIGQIVFTALEVPGVSAVRITVEGRSKQWPAANGALQELALTEFEYPGLRRSTQPPFPPAPTP